MSAQLEQLQILLADGQAEDADRLRSILTRGEAPRCLVAHAPSLNEALQYLARSAVDAILLSLPLPDAYQLEALERVQRAAPDTPIIILSDHEDSAEERTVLYKGAQDYLIKDDLDRPLLVRTIRHAIERHKVKRELEELAQRMREATVHLEQLCLVDPLTDLLNRRGLDQILSNEMQRAQRHGAELLVMLVDLDDFKQFNDTYGHATGDAILREIATRLRVSVRATDYIARIGGDEFMILLPDTKPAEGHRVAQKLRLAVGHAAIAVASGTLTVTASIGVTTIARATSITELLSQCRQALASSKQAGKNRIAHDRGLQPTDEQAGRIEYADALAALRQGDRFRPVMLPIFHLQDWNLVGYEFLSRSLVNGFEMPEDFFRLCLEDQSVTLVDHLCFRACLSVAATVPRRIRRHLNLFPNTLVDIPLQQILEDIPQGGNGAEYCVELSERQIIGDPSYLIAPIEQLKLSGIQVALDDVGYGRSYLESLIILEPNVVKLDGHCVQGIAQNASRARSVKRLLRMAEALGAQVIAEGIESHDDLAALQQLGVRYGQGFLWGKPAPPRPIPSNGKP